LSVTNTQFGEFIFAYPDIAETPSVVHILKPDDQSEVNESEPITLAWSVQGAVGV
jgi:hypothetical protein